MINREAGCSLWRCGGALLVLLAVLGGLLPTAALAQTPPATEPAVPAPEPESPLPSVPPAPPVDDQSGEAGPVPATPRAVATGKTLAPDGAASDRAGTDVDISGTTMVVGAPGDDGKGSVSVYVKSGGAWTLEQKLVPPGLGGGFGTSVAIDGNTIVVGDPLNDTAGVDAGRVFVFTRAGSVWTQQQTINAPAAAAGDKFGFSVAVANETLIAGAPYADALGTDVGSAHIFLRTGTTWAVQGSPVPTVVNPEIHFGWSVAVFGNAAVIGAPSSYYEGSAYTFDRVGATWSYDNRLVADTETLRFGYSAAATTNRLVVGAEAGRVRVYTPFFGTWGFTGSAISTNVTPWGGFGASVDTDGSTIVVGARYAGTNEGEAFVFGLSGSTWLETEKLTPPPGDQDGAFGLAVAVSGDTAVIGAPGDDALGTDAGAAYATSATFVAIKALADQSIVAGTPAPAVPVYVAQAGGSSTSVVVTATSSDQSLLSDSGLAISGTGGTRSLVMTPNGGVAGTATVTVTATGLNGDVEMTDFDVLIGGVITGTIRKPDGTVLGGGRAELFLGSTLVETVTTYTYGGLQGLYRFDGLAPGTYTIRFSDSGGIYDDEWWNDHQTQGAADVLVIGSSYSLVADAQLSNPVLKGRATSLIVSGAAGVVVEVHQGGTVIDTATTGAEGYWTVSDLAAGTYTLRFVDPAGGYTTEWWNETSIEGNAAPVVVPGGTTTMVNIDLQRTNWLAPGPEALRFGTSVAVDGDRLVGGSPECRAPFYNYGCAYVFEREPGGWFRRARLEQGPGATVAGGFGGSVAVSGNTILVGAPNESQGAGQSVGSVYLFELVGSTWTKVAELSDASDASTRGFGVAVHLDDQRIYVGAGFQSSPGDVFVYDRATLALEQKISSSTPGFGRAVAVEGARLMVGAPGTFAQAGRVVVFDRVGSTWTESYSVHPDSASDDDFGVSLAADAGRLAVGASTGQSSITYVFGLGSSTATKQLRAVRPNAGMGVGLHGDELVVSGQDVHAYHFVNGEWLLPIEVPNLAGSAIAMGADSFFLGRHDQNDGSEFGAQYGVIEEAADSGFTLSDIADQNVTAGDDSIPFAVYDTDGNPDALDVEVTSSNSWLLPPGSMSVTGTGTSRDLHLHPLVGISGTATITVTVSDVDGGVASNSFVVTTGGIIRGTVSDGGGPLAGITVRLHHELGFFVADTTAADGTYEFGGLYPGHYRLEFVDPAGLHTTEWWDDQPDEATADAFLVTTRTEVVADAQLALGPPGGGAPVNGPDAVDEDTGTPDVPAVAPVQDTTPPPPANLSVGGTAPGAAPGDRFGTATARSGSWVAIGAPDRASSSGSVYLYEDVAGALEFRQEVTAPDQSGGDSFGRGLTLSGTTLVVGAPGDDDRGTNTGSSYVFERSGGVWGFEQKILAPGAIGSDALGSSLSVDADRVLLGAPGALSSANSSGRAFVFSRTSAVWTFDQRLIAPGTVTGDLLGTGVALDGARLVLGAPGDDSGKTDAGAVHVYERQVGSWVRTQELLGSTRWSSGALGRALALDGGRIFAGVPGSDAGASNAGAVLVFDDSGSGFEQVEQIQPTPTAGAGLGGSVGVAGSLLAVGAPSAPGGGRVAVFVEGLGAWWLSEEFGLPTGSTGDNLGAAVAVGPAWVLGGAPGDDDVGSDAGSYYMIDEFSPVIAAPPDQVTPAGAVSDEWSFTVVDPDDPVADLDVVATTSDPARLPVSGITLTGTGAVRSVSVHPADVAHTATVTLTVSDPGGLDGADDFAVHAGGIVRGTVTDGSAPLASIPVRLHILGGGSLTTSTDAQGRYEFSGLDGGAVQVEFASGSSTWVTEFWDDAATSAGAEWLTVTRQDEIVADAELDRALLSGVVVDRFTLPVEGITAEVWSGSTEVASVVTGTNGEFVVVGIGPGTYTLRFVDPLGRFAPEWYQDATDQGSAQPVVLVAGATEVVEAVIASTEELPMPPDFDGDEGGDVALSGDWAIVGTLIDEVHFYNREPGGAWALVQTVDAPDPLQTFGQSVAIDGSIAAVGAPSSSGDVYILRLIDGVWVIDDEAVEPPSGYGKGFGSAVALDGTRVVVGAPQNQSARGAVVVADVSTPIPTIEATLLDPAGAVDDYFGWSVAIDGPVVVAGAPGVGDSSGRALVFEEIGTWALTEVLEPEGGTDEGGEFATAVAVSDSTIAVSSPTDSTDLFLQGRVDLFGRSGSDWVVQETLLSPEPAATEFFGNDVSLQGSRLLVGAPQMFGPGIGQAYLFRQTGSDWTSVLTFEPIGGESEQAPDGPWFGSDVALDGSSALVAAFDWGSGLDAAVYGYDWMEVDSVVDAVDVVPGDGACASSGGACTLRAAVMEANAQPGPDRIVLDAATYLLSRPGSGENSTVTGDLDVTDTLEVVGAGVATTTVDAAGVDRVFHARPGAHLTLRGVTVTGGSLTNTDGGAGVYGDKGAAVELVDVRVTGNTTAGPGGGVFGHEGLVARSSEIDHNTAGLLGGGVAGGGVVVEDSVVHDNVADAGGGIVAIGLSMSDSSVEANVSAKDGGGVLTKGPVDLDSVVIEGNGARSGGGWYHLGDGLVAAVDVRIVGNTASRLGGGAVLVEAHVSVSGATVAANTAADGGGLVVGDATVMVAGSTISGNAATGVGGVGISGGLANIGASVTVRSSTISGNTAALVGGGVANVGTLRLEWSTITANGASAGGGVYTDATQGLPASTSLRGTALVDQVAGGDCGGPTAVVSLGANAFTSGTCASTGTDLSGLPTADLGALADNGGLTFTHLPAVSSPLVDAATGCPVTDQRGQPRGSGGVCDIGATES